MNPRSVSWWRAALVLALLPLVALAQDAPYVNPPGRVAQLNYFEGPVSFAPAGYGQWAAAVLNRPLTQGDRVWNGAGARSELHVGSTTMQLAGETSLAFTTLDDRTVQLALTQGSVVVRVRELPAGQRFEIDTPNLALTAAQPGSYRVDVDAAAGTTAVTVRSGSVQVLGTGGVPLAMKAVEQITFSGNALAQVSGQSAPLQDAFGYWAAARDDAEDGVVAARYVSRDMVGYQELDRHGSWRDDPTYGAVWVPSVTLVDWAPYRYGHWAFIAPWGWTWIDDEPWGFAPFHYGRWAVIDARWCWVPGPIAVRPMYAPALVAFVGGSVGGVNFSVSIGGLAQPAVGWFPLAPGEIWHPAFRASPTYVTEVNRTVIVNRNVTNITNIVNVNRVTNVYSYQNQPQAVTAVSARAFTRGEHLRGNTVAVTQAQLADARVVPAPAPTRDPRAIFAASRLTQPHPAPPAAVLERPVLVAPAPVRAHEAAPAAAMRVQSGSGALPQTAARAPAAARGPALADDGMTARQPSGRQPDANALGREPSQRLPGRTEPGQRVQAAGTPPPPDAARVQPVKPPRNEGAQPTARSAPQPSPRTMAQREQAERAQAERAQAQHEQIRREEARREATLRPPQTQREEEARAAHAQRERARRQAEEERRP